MGLRKNKKIQLAIIIIAILILLILIVGAIWNIIDIIFFDKLHQPAKETYNDTYTVNLLGNNSPINQNNNNINPELENIMYFCNEEEYNTDQSVMTGGKLVAINNEGKKIEIMEMDSSIYYFDHYKNKLYILKTDGKRNENMNDTYDCKDTFYYIDLTQGNGNYNLIPFAEITETRAYDDETHDICVIGDSIYYVYSFGHGYTQQIRGFNVKTGLVYNTAYIYPKKIGILTIGFSTGLCKVKDRENLLVFNDPDSIYLRDLQKGVSKLIDANIMNYSQYKDKIVYQKNIDNERCELYEYDILTNHKTKISNQMGKYGTVILPYENGYIYYSDNVIYKYIDGKIFELYRSNENDRIMNIWLLSNDKLIVYVWKNIKDITKTSIEAVSLIMDLKNNTLENTNIVCNYTNLLFL